MSGTLRNHRRRLLLTPLLLAMLLALGTAASAAPGWTVVPTVNPSAGDNVLNGVAVRSSTDAWAVGDFTGPDPDDDGLNMLTEHWNGTSWSQVPTPAVLHLDESLLAVSTSSASDAWAVGFEKSVGAAGRFPLAAHWNGSAWSIVPTRNATTSNLLTGVAAVAANNVWAVGYTITTDGSNQPDRTLVEHWNGSTWSVVASPSPASNDTLTGVAARSATDIWAVGSSNVFSRTLALRETG